MVMSFELDKRKAFTMVEILVALTIIMFLMAMLFPAVHKSLENGRRTGCLSNARQIGIAMKHYALENQNNFPSGGSANSVFVQLTPSYLAVGSIFLCKSDVERKPGKPGAFGKDNNSYSTVSGLGRSSDDQPLVFDYGVGTSSQKSSESPSGSASVSSLTHHKWSTASSHKGNGGNIFYNDGRAEFKKDFDTGQDGNDGMMVVPGS